MEKINKLLSKFKKYNLDGYLIPKNDEFFSEYVPHNKDNLQYISNFSGSYGMALILKKKNFLFVDGRYTVQANIQSGKAFTVITLPFQKNKRNLKIKDKTIGFNPRLFSERSLEILSNRLKIKCAAVNEDLINSIKGSKKNFISKKFYTLNENITGEKSSMKIKKLKKNLAKNNIDIMLITSSENIAWLLNIRGYDSNYSPIPNCFLIIDKMRVFLFCDLRKINSKLKKKLNFVSFLDIDQLEFFLKNVRNKNFLVDDLTCSIFHKNIIKRNNKILRNTDPIYFYKSQKNNTEIKNSMKIHEYDGVALTKFIFWIQNNFKKKRITELKAQEKLLEFRKKFKQFKFSSFPTISSTGPNGAIVHYNATQKTNRILEQGNIYLVDSGGQYHYGTTDVTRTISLDSKDEKIKEVYTRVLQGHLNLSNYKLKKNTTGSILDKVARKNLKKMRLDYAHGTGHGVGYFLNVHEGPQSISKKNNIRLKPGMIISNEPGYYEKGKFGLRIENLLYVKKNGNGMKLENLTYVPIDKNLIIKRLLRKKEILWLNKYHEKVYKKLQKYMSRSELSLLKKSCSNI